MGSSPCAWIWVSQGWAWALSARHHVQHAAPRPQSPGWMMGNVASTLLKLYSFHKEVRTPLQRLHELEKGGRGRSWELRTPVEAGGRSCVLSMMPTVLP